MADETDKMDVEAAPEQEEVVDEPAPEEEDEGGAAADGDGDGDDDDDEDGGAAEGEPTPLLDAPLEVKGKRQRKAVERITVAVEEKPKKELVIEAGPGTPIGDLENVCFWLNSKKAENFVPIHIAMYGTRGKNKDIKKNIRAFSGYPKSMPASEKEKRVAGLEKRMLAQLKDIATWLDLETSGTKADVITAIVKFLEKPKASGNKHPKEIKDAARERKEKKISKKKKAKGSGKGSKKSASGKKSGSGKRLAEPSPPKSALMLYAISVRDEVKGEVGDGDKAALMQVIKERYAALSQADVAKWMKKAEADALRYAKEKKAYDDQENEDLLAALEDDDDSDAAASKSPARKRKPAAAASKKKTKSPAKKAPAKAVSDDSDDSDDDDSSDDDEPLVKKTKSGPSDAEIKAAVASVLKGANLEEMTKKKVRAAVAEKFPGIDMDKHKDFVGECVVNYITENS